jgi:hypothetical protein
MLLQRTLAEVVLVLRTQHTRQRVQQRLFDGGEGFLGHGLYRIHGVRAQSNDGIDVTIVLPR